MLPFAARRSDAALFDEQSCKRKDDGCDDDSAISHIINAAKLWQNVIISIDADLSAAARLPSQVIRRQQVTRAITDDDGKLRHDNACWK